jgi:hypothetical protein
MMSSGLQRAADAFKSVDWVVPAYFGLGQISAIGGAIERAEGEVKQEVLRYVLPLMYTPRHLAAMLLERYSKQVHVREFSKPIAESIEVAFGGMWHAAITTLMPVIEGVLMLMRDARPRGADASNRNWLTAEVVALVKQEQDSPHCFDERVVMLTALRDFCNKRLYTDTNNYKGLNELNRHGILHGLFKDYGDPLNFYRLISILDLLCFVIALYNRGSVSTPNYTPESDALARYYLTVIANSTTRPDCAEGGSSADAGIPTTD